MTELKNKEKEKCIHEKPKVKMVAGYFVLLSEHLTNIFKIYCIMEANNLFIFNVFPSLGALGLLTNGSEGYKPELFIKQGYLTNHHKMEVIKRFIEFVLKRT